MPVVADGGIEPDDPELAERRLLVLAVGERVASGAHERLVRVVELLGAQTAVSFGARQDVLSALIGVHSSFDACHT